MNGAYISPFYVGPGWIKDKEEIASRPFEKDVVTIDGVELPNDQEAIRAQHERNKAAKEAEFAAYNARKAQENTGRVCPIDDPMGSGGKKCKRTCALFIEGQGCTMRRTEPRPTDGKSCPYFGTCRHDCAMFSSGCTM